MQVLTVDFTQHDAARMFAESLKNTGFAVLKNHPIDFERVKTVYQEWRDFFASDDKSKYLYKKESQDGYYPISISETAKGNTVKDIKEFYSYYPWGQYPENVSDLLKYLYDDLLTVSTTLLQWLEEHTVPDIREQFSMPLSEMIKASPRSQLRILHYPPLTGKEEEGAVRSAAHEDIDLLTILVAGTTPGLQVKDSQGNWHDVKCDPGTIVVNAGDMLQMCSKGYYRSTTHRVINPTGEAAKQSRMSMPLFLHPHDHVRLSDTHTAREYLIERLKELGVY